MAGILLPAVGGQQFTLYRDASLLLSHGKHFLHIPAYTYNVPHSALLSVHIRPGKPKKHRELVFAAAQETIANAVKHAGAKHMKISFEENSSWLCCCFENDGTVP